MTRTLCTLFDKNFLARGLTLHRSLVEQCPDFTLWMMCMDGESYDLLAKLKLEKVRLLRVSEVEDAAMLAVKPTRKPVEYCWMFSSALPLYLLEKTGADMVAYIDADTYFYSSPEPIYRELGNRSIMIIPHNFSGDTEKREKKSGIYNVGITIFRNDENARACLHWWKERCIEWCYDRHEDGRFGDQLYLNDWPTRFKGVHVLSNPGVNVGPWNVASFTKRSASLISFHFHGLKIYMDRHGRTKAYPITIYEPAIYKRYISALQQAYGLINTVDPTWKYGTVKPLDILKRIKQNVSLLYRIATR